jgi:hypothetical protein
VQQPWVERQGARRAPPDPPAGSRRCWLPRASPSLASRRAYRWRGRARRGWRRRDLAAVHSSGSRARPIRNGSTARVDPPQGSSKGGQSCALRAARGRGTLRRGAAQGAQRDRALVAARARSWGNSGVANFSPERRQRASLRGWRSSRLQRRAGLRPVASPREGAEYGPQVAEIGKPGSDSSRGSHS